MDLKVMERNEYVVEVKSCYLDYYQIISGSPERKKINKKNCLNKVE